MERPGPRRCLAAACAATLLLAACGSSAPTAAPSISSAPTAIATPSPAPPLIPTAAATTPGASANPFQPVDVFATPSPAPPAGALPTDQVDTPAPRRPVPAQSADWLAVKAAGRVALVNGHVAILPAGAKVLLDPVTGAPVPARRLLETGYARWIIEPLGYGRDAAGHSFRDENLWNLCEPGATAVALYYWQQLTGRPNVSGTAGWFLDPYADEGVGWPSSGPRVEVSSAGKRLGTYWSGTDGVNGYTAHARGYIAYLGMAIKPPGWQSTGISVFADNKGHALYPTIGAPRTNIQVALNWEASGHDPAGWSDFYYASVMRFEPRLARDLAVAVTLDVGRDGVPVVVELDTHGLPNWQNGKATPHIRHAIAIVGYDNAANPPTFTYIDTCGRACNNRGGNQNGALHVIAQAQMVKAIQDTVGSGFVW